MMRFNGYDRRLERMLESTLMILEALPRPDLNNNNNNEMSINNGSNSNIDLNEVIEYSIMGHSGDTANELFVDFPSLAESRDSQQREKNSWYKNSSSSSPFDRIFGENGTRENNAPPTGPFNENEKMAILEKMLAHSQFCFPGDNTLPATEIAISRCATGAEGDGIERLVIVISDANFRRYNIDPNY